MTPVGICFVILHSKKAQAYFFIFSDRFETSRQTDDVMCRLAIKRSVYYWDWLDLIKHHLATEMF